MKKILTASLVAIMAVTAANADIASTQYVNAKAGADETGVFTFEGAAAGKTNLTAAINAVATKVDGLTEGGEGSVSSQIGSAISGLDVDTITVEDGKYVKTVSETDGKVSVTTGDLIGQINEVGDNKNDTSTVAPTTAAVAGYVKDKLFVMTNNVDTKISDALSETKQNVAGLQLDVANLETNSATKEELTSQVNTAKTELQGKIDAVVAGGLTANSVAGTAIKSGTISETQLNDTVNASLDKADSALQKTDIATGTANGTIKVDDVDVAVAGLGTAAYMADTAFDAAGAATAAETRANAYADGKVNALDVTDNAVAGSYVSAVSETDGKISVTRAELTPVAKMNVPEACENGTATCALVYDNVSKGLKWESIVK